MEGPKRIWVNKNDDLLTYFPFGTEYAASYIEYIRADLVEDLIVAARRVVDEGLPEHSWCRCLEDVLEAMGEEV